MNRKRQPAAMRMMAGFGSPRAVAQMLPQFSDTDGAGSGRHYC